MKRTKIHILAGIMFLSVASNMVMGRSLMPVATDSVVQNLDYLFKVWQTKDGLPQNSVNAICQTRDGYLWLGTEEGLVRFDGVRFTVFNDGNTPELKSKFIAALHESSDSTLWIGTNGGGLTSFHEGKFQHHPLEGLPAGRVISIASGADGSIWVTLFAGGVRKLIEGKEQIDILDRKEFNVPLHAAFPSREGVILIGPNVAFHEYQTGKYTKYDLGNLGTALILTALYDNVSSVLWIGTFGDGLYAFGKGSTKHYTRTQGLPDDKVVRLYLDSEHKLWIGTEMEGLSVLLSNGKFIRLRDSLSLPILTPRSILEDREGNIWIGNRNEGLYRLTKSRLRVLGTQQGVYNKHITSIHPDGKGRIWVGTIGGGVIYGEREKFYPAKFNATLQSKTVNSIISDKIGALWIGTTNGLYRIMGNNVRAFTRKNGLSSEYINSLYEDSDGRIWVGTPGGLSIIEDGKITIYRRIHGLSHNSVGSVLEDGQGGYWIGTFGGGLNYFKDGQWKAFTQVSGLSSDAIMTLYLDAEGMLWIGTLGGGLSRFWKGEFTRYRKSDGLFDDVVYQILEDSYGNLWMGSNLGIFRIEKRQLNAFAAGNQSQITSYSYGVEHGMEDVECNGGFQPSGWKMHDQSLWFPTQAGIVVVDPPRVISYTKPPPILLEEVLVNREVVAADNGSEFSPESREIEFRYTALQYFAPTSITFKYFLEGFDRDWVDAKSRRVAYYTNLPPGDYRFRVIARGSDGMWTEQGASFAFRVAPFFYQTWWFYTAIAVVLVLIGAGAQYVYHQFRQKELFASYLQSQVIRAQLQALRSQLNPHFLFNTLNAITGLILTNPRNAIQMMENLSDFLRITIDSELLQKVPLHAEIVSLKKYVEIEQLRLGNRLTVQYDIPPELMEIGIPSLILQPLVENAIKHGIVDKPNGGNIWVQARAEDHRLRIEVRDNGKGINNAGTKAIRGGVGLANTRSRLQQLYGEAQSFTILDAPGGGTIVSVILPIEST